MTQDIQNALIEQSHKKLGAAVTKALNKAKAHKRLDQKEESLIQLCINELSTDQEISYIQTALEDEDNQDLITLLNTIETSDTPEDSDFYAALLKLLHQRPMTEQLLTNALHKHINKLANHLPIESVSHENTLEHLIGLIEIKGIHSNSDNHASKKTVLLELAHAEEFISEVCSYLQDNNTDLVRILCGAFVLQARETAESNFYASADHVADDLFDRCIDTNKRYDAMDPAKKYTWQEILTSSPFFGPISLADMTEIQKKLHKHVKAIYKEIQTYQLKIKASQEKNNKTIEVCPNTLKQTTHKLVQIISQQYLQPYPSINPRYSLIKGKTKPNNHKNYNIKESHQ